MFLHWMRWLLSLLMPSWMQNRHPDAKHFYRRLFTQAHRKKRQRLIYLWLVAAIILLLIPSLPLMIVLCLFCTFISFSLLDESS